MVVSALLLRRAPAAALSVSVIFVAAESPAIPNSSADQAPATLPSPTIADAGDRYGFSVDVAGPYLFCGLPGHDFAVADQGGVEIHEFQSGGWVSVGTAVMPNLDSGVGDDFGYSVDGHENLLIVGARLDDDAGGANQGSAWIFRRTDATWFDPPAKLVASDADATDLFGTSVSIFGDTAVVGAPGNDDAGLSSGSAYVFTFDGANWNQTAKLTASDAAGGSQFGGGVAVYNDTIAIASPRHTDVDASEQGAVYVFTRDGEVWTEATKILASDAAMNDFFGSSLAMDRDTIVVGAPNDDDDGDASGSVYIYTGSGSSWAEQAKLTASDASNLENFGSSVDILHDRVIVGARSGDGDGLIESDTNGGSAYVFERSGAVWSENAKFRHETPHNDDLFGRDVAVGIDVIVVGVSELDNGAGANAGEVDLWFRSNDEWAGADQKRVNFGGNDWHAGAAVALEDRTAAIGVPGAISDQGAVLIYELRGAKWTSFETNSLQASDSQVQGFASALAMSGDTVVVGAPGRNGDTGGAYVFVRTAGVWSEQQILTPASGLAGDLFGSSVAIDGDTIVIGSPGDDDFAGADQGSIYVFTRSGAMWTEEAKILESDDGAGNLFGSSVDIHAGTIVAGAPLGGGLIGDDQGAVDVLTGAGASWSLQQRLEASDGLDGDEFGFAAAVDGDLVIVGAPGKTVNLGGIKPEAGSAYFFSRNAGVWTEEKFIDNSAPNGGERTGHSVDISGNRAVVGAPNEFGSFPTPGLATFHYRMDDTWVELYTLPIIGSEPAVLQQPPWNLFHIDGENEDHFGAAVAIDGEWILVGAPEDDSVSPVALTDLGSFVFFACADELLNSLVMNTTKDTFHLRLSEAIAGADTGDHLLATPQVFWDEPFSISPVGKAFDVESTGAITTMSGSNWDHTGNSSVRTAPARPAAIWGEFSTGPGPDFDFFVDHLHVVGPDATTGDGQMNFFATNTTIWGGFDTAGESFNGGADLTVVDPKGLRNQAYFAQTGGDLVAGLFNQNGATFEAFFTSGINADVRNSGTLFLHNATLSVAGTVINEGAGHLTDGGSASGDLPSTLEIGGSLRIRTRAPVTMANDGDVIRVGGVFDARSVDNDDIDFSGLELHMTGPGAKTVELMSTDVGSSPTGLDRTLPGHYPLHAFRVGDGINAGTIDMIDSNDNDGLGQIACEAMYVCDLIIEGGATLNTNGCRIYYKTLSNSGFVDNAANLIPICVADLDGSGVVDGADLAALLAQWGGPGSADLTGDGTVDGADLAALLAAWGGCP